MVRKVGHYFLKLLDKHSPQHHKLHKIFKNTLKVSYNCTKNIKSIISCHNKKVSHQNQPCSNEQKCNCIRKELRPLNGKNQAENIVYEATTTCNEWTHSENICIGIAETAYSNHIRSFNLPAHKNDSELSKEFWKINVEILSPKWSGESWGNVYIWTVHSGGVFRALSGIWDDTFCEHSWVY